MPGKAFKNLKAGLEQAIAHARGEVHLNTRHVEMPKPPKPMTSKQIARLRREKLQLSQGVFAKLLNAAPQTVQAWEHGRSKPSGCALRFLQLIDKNPEIIEDLLKSA